MNQIKKNSRKAKADTQEYAEVKRGMVNAAIDLMAIKGLQKFRFEDLAKKVNLNRATVYRYFDSKEELVTEVMLALMHQMTGDILDKTVGVKKITSQMFTDSLYEIITDLRTKPRYAIIMEAQNVETFAKLTHDHFSAITTDMLEKFMMGGTTGQVLKKGVSIDDAVYWLMHQIISYGFFGLKGETKVKKKEYLKKMVVSVII